MSGPGIAQSEARFTQPSALCPHPARWHSTDDDSTEIEVSALVGSFVTALRPEFVIETGTAWGQTAEAIGRALDGTDGVLFTYETDAERVEFSRARCRELPVSVIQKSSLNGLSDLYPEHVGEVGFVWLDSLFDLRPAELSLVYNLLSPRGVVGIHDTAAHHPLWEGLKRHDRHFEKNWTALQLPTPRGVAFLQRRVDL